MLSMHRFLLLLVILPLHAAIDLSRIQLTAPANSIAAKILLEETQKRTGTRWGTSGKSATLQLNPNAAGISDEGYILEVNPAAEITMTARTERGLIYAVGAFLRKINLSSGKLSVDEPFYEKTSPAYPLRGHQLGYRATANSWDAWTVQQFDQYIRELALLGANAVENIPFQEPRPSPLMKLSRREMNREISSICAKYHLQYWIWLPADFELSDSSLRIDFLKQFEQMVAETPRLDAIFVPGGDPGHNPPELVMPLLEDLAAKSRAKVWLSLQGFNREKEDYVYRWISDRKPKWLGGLVAGPSSPPASRSRENLPANYGIRLYPDITHNKICQFQVPGLDQAIALTLGREAVNPRPAEMAEIHNRYAGTSIGFLSYSDGVHDDINKAVFTALSWDPARKPREILIDYSRLFFPTANPFETADAILGLERNWRGPLVHNGNVEATLREWNRLTATSPDLSSNWRWQMNQLRAAYDCFVRRRLIHETAIEQRVNAELLKENTPASQRIAEAGKILNNWKLKDSLREEIIRLCDKLFHSIGLQTSVEKYQASGAERGAVLDFIDYPLNNRYWLEDEFQKLTSLSNEQTINSKLREIATWENPGPGGFYDDIGNESRSPHAEQDERDEPMFWWLNQGQSRLRLSSLSTMWPKRLKYEGLDRNSSYLVKTGGQGQSLLRIDGKKIEGRKSGDFHIFSVPAEALSDTTLELTWDIPTDEQHLNWRQRSRLAEVWLLKN